MSDNEAPPTGALIVALPAAGDPAVGDVPESHVTCIWFGEATNLPDELILEIRSVLDSTVEMFEPFDAEISGVAMIGQDRARVYLVESQQLVDIRMELLASSAVRQAYSLAERQFPCWVPHLTMSYDGPLPEEWPERFRIDSLGLWLAGSKTDFPLLGGPADSMAETIEAAGCVVPPIFTLADVDLGVQVANKHPNARWYVARRATALGASARIPEQWAKELAPK